MMSLKNVLLFAGLAVFAFALICLFFSGLLINPLIERRITAAFGNAYPGYTIRIAGLDYNVWVNRLECDSVAATSPDSTSAFTTTGISITGVDRLPLILGGGVTAGGLRDARASARDIVLNFSRSDHEFRFASLLLSAPESTLTIEGLRFRPRLDDDRFFATSAYRKTLFRLVIPVVRVSGLAWLMPGNVCRADDVVIEDASLTVLINKEKPVNAADPDPRMPAALLASLGGGLDLRSVRLLSGRLSYQERFTGDTDPAVLTFDSVGLTATGIGNIAGRADTMVLRARGIFMGAGVMSLTMTMPVATPGLSFRYSGSLTRMDLRRLNPFVESAEGLRLKTGVLHSAAYEIDVKSGKAGGVVRAAYEDLHIRSIDQESGSEDGIGDFFTSFIANNFTLRTTNLPDASDTLRLGVVRYDKRGPEAFLTFAWFALRGGIGDVVGF